MPILWDGTELLYSLAHVLQILCCWMTKSHIESLNIVDLFVLSPECCHVMVSRCIWSDSSSKTCILDDLLCLFRISIYSTVSPADKTNTLCSWPMESFVLLQQQVNAFTIGLHNPPSSILLDHVRAYRTCSSPQMHLLHLHFVTTQLLIKRSHVRLTQRCGLSMWPLFWLGKKTAKTLCFPSWIWRGGGILCWVVTQPLICQDRHQALVTL